MSHSHLELVNTDQGGNIAYMMPWSALAQEYVSSLTSENMTLSEALQANTYSNGAQLVMDPVGSATPFSYSVAGFLNEPQGEEQTPAEDESIVNLSSQTSATAGMAMQLVTPQHSVVAAPHQPYQMASTPRAARARKTMSSAPSAPPPRIRPVQGSHLAAMHIGHVSTPGNDQQEGLGSACTSHKQARDAEQLEGSDNTDRDHCSKKSKRAWERSACDLSTDTQAVLKVAYSHFKCQLATVNPFPDVTRGIEDYILESISAAQEQTALTVAISLHVINLVTTCYDLGKCMLMTNLVQVKAHVPQLRGQVKTLTCEKVKSAYGFMDPQESGDGGPRGQVNVIQTN
ncbi:hypothetical protein JVT61DRAFT_9717 [Boletus reticuloceps]|uniref:DUF6532 domain-containing protein n=1 Tax=Boletus reticuloceps TaxID=495285 RepID=A0A8I2YG73_9AGAM|nr:hypothetical protein JVT61DRAFT_9717 [Boletus reticuloceps]